MAEVVLEMLEQYIMKAVNYPGDKSLLPLIRRYPPYQRTRRIEIDGKTVLTVIFSP